MTVFSNTSTQDTKGTVYVVDDDDAIRDSLRWLLEANDYKVELYDSGESFIAKYDPNAIAVLVLDVRMPGMSGLEVQEHLLARKADLPIIFITGHGDVPMAVRALKKGAVDFIEKPFQQAALKAQVEHMLNEARERRMKNERQSLNEALLAKLTPREQQVLGNASWPAVSISRSPMTLAFQSRRLKLTARASWIRRIWYRCGSYACRDGHVAAGQIPRWIPGRQVNRTLPNRQRTNDSKTD